LQPTALEGDEPGFDAWDCGENDGDVEHDLGDDDDADAGVGPVGAVEGVADVAEAGEGGWDDTVR